MEQFCDYEPLLKSRVSMELRKSFVAAHIFSIPFTMVIADFEGFTPFLTAFMPGIKQLRPTGTKSGEGCEMRIFRNLEGYVRSRRKNGWSFDYLI